MYESVLKSVSLYNILLLINTKVFEVIYVLVTSAVVETLFCVSEFIKCLSCVIVKCSDMC